MRPMKILTLFAALSGILLCAAPVAAQESDGAVITRSDADLTFPKPDGWIEGDPVKGVIVRLRAAGDSASHVDFRMAPNVGREKAQVFFTSFHASLQASGLKKIRDTETKTHGDKNGKETEYETKGTDGAFRLIIWQVHVGQRAWMVVGFFDSAERDTLYRDFQKLIETASFSK